MSQVIKTVDCPREKFGAGQLIFEEGASSDCFYLIRSGEVEVFRGYGKPNQLLLATIREGQVLGEISSIDGQPRTASARAKSEVEVVKVSAQTLIWQIKQCPAWFGAIVLDLVERLRATDALLDHPSMSSLKPTGSATGAV